MPFDISSWKAQLSVKLPGWRTRMQAGGINSVYFFIAATSLFPVLQAAQSGDWSALVSLGTILGGAVSTNLLANLVQKLKDKSDVEVAETLQSEAKSTPELKVEVDVLLEKLNALQQAELVLSIDDRAWFVTTIQKELDELKSSVTFTATLIGDGGIGQGAGAIGLGKNAILIQGGLTGNFIQTQVIESPKTNPDSVKHQRALETYLNRLSRACLSLPLAALGGEDSVESDVTLDKVYIELNTTEVLEESSGKEKKGEFQEFRGLPEKEKLVTALEAASAHRRLVLLGDPGAGKSTFIKKLLAWQASVGLGKANPPEGFSANLIPVLISLRDLAPRLAELDMGHLSAQKQDELFAKAIWEYIQADLGEDCADFSNDLHEALKSGQCLLALDGLDEVPQDLRGRVRQAVDALLKRYDLQRIIVTCRVRSYVGEAVLPQFISRTLAPFSEEQIGTFVEGWYNTQRDLGRINATQAKERTADLSNAATQSDLRELSSNPMLLTTMSIIHQREVGLPRERVRLYHLAVEVLLRRWQKHKVGDAALAEFLKNDLKLRAVMENLAYITHRASTESGGAGTLLRKDAIDLLEKTENLGSLQLAGEFLDYVDQRAGLLVGYGGELSKPTAYSFPHRTFQEYLAGAYLAGQRDRVRTFYEHAAEGDGWDLAAQLAFEELFYNRRAANELLDLAYQLGATFKRGAQNERAFLWAGQMTSLVERDMVERDSHPSGGKAYLEKLLPGLVNILGGSLQPLERAEAGRVLGKLGDPRLELTTLDAMQFCHVPAGKFILGSKKGAGGSDEQPQHEVELPAYWMGRYPVTNAQYSEFVLAKGYQNPEYWLEARDASVWGNGKVKGFMDNDPRQSPVDFGEPFSLPNHPVVGITWYEMLAFTRWLTETWQTQGFLPFDWQVVMPSEPEWEKAARGGLNIPYQPLIHPVTRLSQTHGWQVDGKGLKMIQNPTPQRTYPWGDDFDQNFSNVRETGVNSSTTPCCFSKNISPYGIVDLSGNVWEWTRSINGKYPYPVSPKERAERENLAADSNTYRVLRGGAFLDYAVSARCAYRNGDDPDFRGMLRGFRVVVVFSRASF